MALAKVLKYIQSGLKGSSPCFCCFSCYILADYHLLEYLLIDLLLDY